VSLFRPEALEALAAPEELDRPLPLIRAGWWGLLLGLLLFGGAVVTWAFLGRVPVRIGGKGVLLRPDALLPVQSRTSGPVAQLTVRVGDCVRAGQVLARIEPVQLRLRRQESVARLTQLRDQDRIEALEARRQRSSAAADLNRILPYRDSGAIAEQTFVDKERELQRVEAQLLAEANRRAQAITAEQLSIRSLDEEIARSNSVVAPAAGCIVDQLVQPAQVLQPGSTVFELDRSGARGALVSLAFFPAQDGKRLKVGQAVRITPTTTRAQRHGGIQGTILSIRPLPVSREGLRNSLGIASLVEAVQPAGAAGGSELPLIEAVTSLRRDPRSRSGYDWGGGPGPDLVLSPGTTTEVSVLVEGRQPISYVIPLLRDLSGIY
jgi:multidrug efflux pump subunit AcrA (membrane-fusion protein)